MAMVDLLKLIEPNLDKNDTLEIDILKKYNINYEKCISTDELIFEIEEYLNEDGDASDLENLSSRLAEYKYYYETNK